MTIDQPSHGPESPEMRILFITWELDVGGFQNHWHDLILGLQQRGTSVRLVCMGPGGEAATRLAQAGVDVTVMNPKPNRWPLHLPRLARIASTFQPTAIVSYCVHEMWLGAMAGRLLRVPSFVNWHSPPYQYTTRDWAFGARAAAMLGSGVICVSDSQVPELVSRGFRRNRITVVPNGIPDPIDSTADREQLRRELGINQRAAVAVAVARLAPEKRLDRFIRAVSEIKLFGQEVVGVVVGDGPERDRLERLAAEHGGDVRFVGFDHNPSRWIRAADAVCLTSGLEAHPLSLIEGLACGRPFVAMDTGGVRAMSNSGSVGLVVDQGDERGFRTALTRLLSETTLCSTMGLDAREVWAAEYSHDQMVDRYATILRSGTTTNECSKVSDG